MMQQYLALKAQAPDALLLFRLGDFFELFLDDAELAAPLLDLVLTTRDRDTPDPVPMCGIPAHAAETYIRKLLAAGHAVAIADQVEDARQSRGLVRREIVERASPGLVGNPDRLLGQDANYLAAVFVDPQAAPGAGGAEPTDSAGRPRGSYGLAHVDISTGEFAATEIEDSARFHAELARIAPREVVVPDTVKDLALPTRYAEAGDFEPRHVADRVGRLPAGLRPDETSPLARAAAAIWSTVARAQPAALTHIQALRRWLATDHLILDPSTRRHLEITANLRDGGRSHTLLDLLDETRTPLGRRRLEQWVGEPLVEPGAIRERQDRVAEWLEPDSRRRALADALRGVGDLERALVRSTLPSGGARELVALRDSLRGAAGVGEVEPLEEPCADVAEDIGRVLVDDPPPAPRGEPHTGYVRDDVDAEVDGIRRDSDEGRRYLASLEARERERTGIASLKVKYHRVFGYSIEVTKVQAARVPSDYRRKQTMANAERFTTDELESWEGRVLRARERAAAAEARVVEELRARVSDASERIRRLARAIAELDVAQSLASVARAGSWVRPEVDTSLELEIEAGRHPVVERTAPDGFVPNDVRLDAADAQLLILTGPNMAGKSTLLRQVALTVLLAQAGSFVPARRARIGIADRIFTRVGASDSLATGESTFMVEMRETATILSEATGRSLVLLDEIGRGTSTFDGLSIAWAVTEYLHDTPGLRPRTLFATHYHELADLARTKSRVRNFHFACAERGDEVLFLRRMEPGAASRTPAAATASKWRVVQISPPR
jgi:DNA mismatch repair protein MutS